MKKAAAERNRVFQQKKAAEAAARKAKVTAKKVAKKGTKGTSQLATSKPTTGGLQGINTPQGVNVSGGGQGGGGTTKP